MPEPFSTTVIAGYSLALWVASRSGTAVSEEARAIRDSASLIKRSEERSFALFGSRDRAISEVFATAGECSAEGWDEDGAVPLSVRAVERAVSFLRAMPQDVPIPEIAPEPDGSVSLDWVANRKRVFSLSIGETDRLAYAWIDGTDKGHAVARFDGFEIPHRIVEGIRDIMDEAHAAVGAA